ncbi:MAG: hypothetical protein ACREVD_13865 [Burkholderiales bacterium]
MSALFIVRAQVVDPAVKVAFDRWYQDEHLPDALKAFKARRAWRGWSDMDGSVHYAFYEFDDVARARAVPGSAAIKELIAEFDRAWGDKVKRTREIVDAVQNVSG